MAINAREVIRNRNQPAAFFAARSRAVEPDISTEPPPTDTAQESYNIQNNIQPDAPVDMPVDLPMDTAVSQTPDYNPNAPREADARTAMVRQSVTAPYLAQIEANRRKADVLRTMPITDKDGNTTSGWKAFATENDPDGEQARKRFTDTDGRAKSGLSAFLQSLGNNPQLRNVRSWGDLAKSVTYSAAAGVGGAIHSSWNEQQKRDIELGKIEAENQRLQKQAESDLNLANKESLNKSRINRDALANKKFETQRDNDIAKGLRDETKLLLKQVMSRAVFDWEEVEKNEPELFAELKSHKVRLGNFDRTHKPIKDQEAGVWKEWNPTGGKDGKGEYQAVDGDEPGEPLIPAEIDGVRLNLTPGQFANFKKDDAKTQYGTEVKNAENKAKQKERMRKYRQDVGEVEGKYNGNITQGNMLYKANAEAQDEIVKQQNSIVNKNEVEDAEFIKQARTQIEKSRALIESNKKEIAKLEGENTSLTDKRKSLIEPTEDEDLPVYNSPVKTVKAGAVSKEEFYRQMEIAKVPSGQRDAMFAAADKAELIKK